VTKIFISYRTHDVDFAAAMVDDHLSARFGGDNVFRDSRHLAPGVDFEPEMWRSLAASTVVVAVIGARWATGAGSTNLLPRPKDFVRRELEFSFSLRIPVIPLLVDGAHLPDAGDLPDSIADLIGCQHLEIRARHKDADLRALVDRVHREYGDQPPVRSGTVALLRAERGLTPEALATLVRRSTVGAGIPMAVVDESPRWVQVTQPETGRAVTMAGDFVRVVDDALRREPAIGPVRMAMHYGEIGPDPDKTVEVARRLLAEDALDGVFRATAGARMLLAVSDDFHRAAVRPGDPSIDKSAYTLINAADGDAWVHVPGFPAPRGLPRYRKPGPVATAAPMSGGTVFNINEVRGGVHNYNYRENP
jgi:hypothetical protein